MPWVIYSVFVYSVRNRAWRTLKTSLRIATNADKRSSGVRRCQKSRSHFSALWKPSAKLATIRFRRKADRFLIPASCPIEIPKRNSPRLCRIYAGVKLMRGMHGKDSPDSNRKGKMPCCNLFSKREKVEERYYNTVSQTLKTYGVIAVSKFGPPLNSFRMVVCLRLNPKGDAGRRPNRPAGINEEG
jgi:hypothetical protein